MTEIAVTLSICATVIAALVIGRDVLLRWQRAAQASDLQQRIEKLEIAVARVADRVSASSVAGRR